MTGGGGVQDAASLEAPSGDGGTAEWRRVYDRVEALLPRVEELAANRARLQEISTAQAPSASTRKPARRASMPGSSRFARKAETSRMRWKTAYIELPLLGNPKIAELQEKDLNDYTTCVDDDNSELKEARTGVELGQNNEDPKGIAGDLRTELRKLKQAYKTLSSRKDKEMFAVLGVKDFLCSQLRTIEKENMALKMEAAHATEAEQKLQKNIEELQVSIRNKDDKVGGLQEQAVNAKKRALVLDGKLLEMRSLVKEKNNEIEKLKNEAGEKRRKTSHEMHCEERMQELETTSRARIAELEKKLEGCVPISAVHQQIDKINATHQEAMEEAKKNLADVARYAEAKEKAFEELQASSAESQKLKDTEIKKLSHDKQHLTAQIESMTREFLGAGDDVMMLAPGEQLARVSGLAHCLKDGAREVLRYIMKPGEQVPTSVSGLAEGLPKAPGYIKSWKQSAARQGASVAFTLALAHHPDLNIRVITKSLPKKGADGKLFNAQAAKALSTRVRGYATRVAGIINVDSFFPVYSCREDVAPSASAPTSSTMTSPAAAALAPGAPTSGTGHDSTASCYKASESQASKH